MDTALLAEALAQVPPFNALSTVDRASLAARMRRHHYARDEVIFHRGDPATQLYVMLAGTVKVALADEQGRETVVALLRGGDVFGELALFDQAPRSATITAVTETDLLLLARDDFLECLDRNPQATREIFKLLARTIRRLTTRVEDLVFLDVPSRVAKLLLDLAEFAGTTREVILTQDDLGAMVGATRVSVNRVLAGLEGRGIIKVSRRHVEILDAAKLRGEIRYQ